MSHIAVWTDSNGRVQRKHYKPDTVDTSDCDYQVDKDGSYPSIEEWEKAVEYYNDTEGFHYEITDATNGLTESETTEMKDALDNGNRDRAQELIYKGFSEVNN